MNLAQLLQLIELGGAEALHCSLDSDAGIFKLALHVPESEVNDGLEIALDSLREPADFSSEIVNYVESISGTSHSKISIELQLAPIVEYMAAAGAASMSLRRDGEAVVVIRLATEVDGQVVAYCFALTCDSLRNNDEASQAEIDQALYGLSVAFRKTLFEARQQTPGLSVGFEGELVFAGSPILCLGGPRDGERVADAGQFLRLPTLGQVYEKRWFRSAGKDRSFYVHSGTSEAAASTMARAVMTGTIR